MEFSPPPLILIIKYLLIGFCCAVVYFRVERIRTSSHTKINMDEGFVILFLWPLMLVLLIGWWMLTGVKWLMMFLVGDNQGKESQ